MSLTFYLKLYNNLTTTKSLSISKKNTLKSFIYDEYKLSKLKKQKLKIGQLRFYYNPITYGSDLTLPQFELKSANNNLSSKPSVLKRSTWTRVVLGVFAVIGVTFFVKYLTHIYNMYFLTTYLEELDDFLLDIVFQSEEQGHFLDSRIKKALKNLLF